MDSSKPIWGGGGVNCCLILGSNAKELQYSIVGSNGQPAMSTKHSELAVVRRLVLSQTLRLGPQQTRVARMELLSTSDDDDVTNQVGIVTPDEFVLAHDHCNFMEGYWTGESMLNIPLTNWGAEPVVFDKGTIVGSVDTVSVVHMYDDIWKEESSGTEGVVNMGNGDCMKLLEGQLDIGKDYTPEHLNKEQPW